MEAFFLFPRKLAFFVLRYSEIWRKVMHVDKQQCLYSVIFFLLLLLTFGLYSFGVNGPFLLDDFNNLANIGVDGGVTEFDDLLRYLFGVNGNELSRSLARLSFVTNDQFWPSSPYGFKLTNIVIHLMNGLLIALLLMRVLPQWLEHAAAERVALLCAALWLLHPLHVSTTLYVVQRMTQLMLFFLLLSLLFYIFYRNAKTYLEAVGALLISGISALFSVLSKENGAVLLLLIPLLEFFCFQGSVTRFQRSAKILSIIMIALFIGFFVVAVINKLPGYDSRFYTLGERIQIQGWVLVEYLRYILLPGNHGMGIFHDDVEWRMQWHGVGGAGWYWLLHIGLLSLAGLLFRHHKVVLFGLLWFYLSHLIESTLIPLEFVFEHRNYLPSIGLLLIVAYVLELAGSQLKSKSMVVVSALLIVVPISYLSIQLAHRAALWSDYRILVHKWAVEHPDSLRAQYAQIVLLESDGYDEKALSTVLAQEKIFDDLTLPLYRIRLACDIDPLAEYDNKLDPALFSKVNYTSGIGAALKKLMISENRECIERQLKGGGLMELVVAVENMPLLKSKSRNYAQYLDMADDFYIKNLDYSRAVIARERLWEAQPTIVTSLKLIELYILGGDYESARKYLDWAKGKKEELWFNDSLAERSILNLDTLLEDIESQPVNDELKD